MTCERCHAEQDDLVRVFDQTTGAHVCPACARSWLDQVMGEWNASLPIWLGTATPEEQRAAEKHANRRAGALRRWADARGETPASR